MKSIPLNYKLKKIFTNWRVILLLFFLIAAVISIHPSPDNEGAAIRSVARNSTAESAGFLSPDPRDRPVDREVITSINQEPIRSAQDFYRFMENVKPNTTLQIRTNRVSRPYRVEVEEEFEVIYLDEYEKVRVTEEVFDERLNRTRNVSSFKEVQKTETRSLGAMDIGITVYDAPKTNLKKGLDLQGGTRVLLQPEEPVSVEDMELIISSMEERLNVYGLTDVVIRSARDLSGESFIVVEIAGANEKEVRELLASQGKFEARVGNTTVFRGGSDVTYVCRTAECSGIDPSYGCRGSQDGQTCRFRFSIALDPSAAQAQADATKSLEVITQNGEKYLALPLDLYLDDELVDSLNIGSELRGRAVTDISISGSGVGPNYDLATFNTLENMKRLQTILVTGSLPVKLEIVKADSISPVLGEEFLRSSSMIALFAVIGVCVMIFIGYRRLTVVIPMASLVLIEIVILLGMAALIGWNLDVAALAGIIVAVGTGVDDQIVITDETLRGRKSGQSWKQRIKSAFFVIMGAYFTTVVAMVPLLFAGAGLLKGFAITTLLGVSIGVFVTRPAFAKVMEILLRDEPSE